MDGSVGSLAQMPIETRQLIVSRMRRIGLDRILFGCDSAVPGNSPRECWAGFHSLPLTDAELRAIAGNVAPYMR
jgi:predicted TIM-barrel fold metal-dependent hydrolase